MHVQVGDLVLEAEWGALSEHLYREERERGRERGREGKKILRVQRLQNELAVNSWRIDSVSVREARHGELHLSEAGPLLTLASHVTY